MPSSPPLFLSSALPLLLSLISACANPVPPTGGPPDRTPPTLLEADPAADAVNVSADAATITFSEYIDQNAFRQAFSITPAFETPPEIVWRGRRVEVRFPEPLRENTTYILTLDNNLRDAHGVALEQPMTFAFSTGPVINRGRLAGRVVEPARGAGVASLEVYAYATPDSTPPAALPERPDYRTQTGPDGRFQLDYLNEQPYYVVALEDLNRNRRPDGVERYAVPPRPVLLADTLVASDTLRWVLAVQDTLPPTLQRIRALSDRRFALRFDEPVRLTSADPLAWAVRDSARGQPVAVEAVYEDAAEPRQVYVLTAPLPPVRHEVRPAGLADSSGNPVAAAFTAFTPAGAADTLGLRFETFVPVRPLGEDSVLLLAPGEPPSVRFNQPVAAGRLQEVVEVQDSTGQALAFTTETQDGRTYGLLPMPALGAGQMVVVRVLGRALAVGDTVYTQAFQRLSARELGEVSGYVVAAEPVPLIVELQPIAAEVAAEPDAPPRRTVADSTGRFFFGQLPAGGYYLRAWADRETNQRWDGGQVLPYRAAEPLAWRADSLRVRPRWETALSDTLRLP